MKVSAHVTKATFKLAAGVAWKFTVRAASKFGLGLAAASKAVTPRKSPCSACLRRAGSAPRQQWGSQHCASRFQPDGELGCDVSQVGQIRAQVQGRARCPSAVEDAMMTDQSSGRAAKAFFVLLYHPIPDTGCFHLSCMLSRALLCVSSPPATISFRWLSCALITSSALLPRNEASHGPPICLHVIVFILVSLLRSESPGCRTVPLGESRSLSAPEVVGHIDLADAHGGHSRCGSVTGASRFLIGL